MSLFFLKENHRYQFFMYHKQDISLNNIDVSIV